MIQTRKTKSGWVIEITNTRGGCLEQGGVCGREVLYKTATLAKHGLSYADDPQAYDICDHVGNAEWLLDQVRCDRVINRGVVIR